MKRFRLIALLFFFCSSYAWAQSPKPASITELAGYNGSDREQLLYAGARSEGKVVWYTSLAGDSYKAMARAFETKYPGLRLEAYRAGGSDLVPRMIEEARPDARSSMSWRSH
jgi:iron(III) transport system substrate-binding protein